MYIHQRQDWPKFHWNQETITPQLALVRHQQGRLMGRMEGIGFKFREVAVLDTLTQDVLKTSEIEGEFLDRDLVRSSIAKRLGLDIGALAPADRNIEGIVEMMLDATQNYAKPLTQNRLFSWHKSLFPSGKSDLVTIKTGSWRDDRIGPMQVISGPIGKETIHFEAPSAKRLDREMDLFLEWFGNLGKTDPVLKAGLAHFWFVTVHPFEDGNGRIARAIADMCLAQSEASPKRVYSMSAQIRLERKKYYDILEQTQKGMLDVTAWLEWFLGCLGRAIANTQDTLSTVLSKAFFWEAHESEAFNDRQRRILNLLLDGFEGKLQSSKWAKLGKCSQDTANRDINDLVNRGILKKDSSGGRSTSYSIIQESQRS